MGYWGWRPLMIYVFISVWVVGCNIVTESAPSQAPSPSPLVTLTVRRLSTPTASPSPTALIRATRIRSSLTPSVVENSPTPMVYVIQAGDTFGDLALRFGVDWDAMKNANPNVDPRALQEGQTIFIPTPATTIGSATPTSTPPSLKLAAPTCYETPINRVLCLGAVENTLDHPIEQVKLVVQILRADGSVIADQTVEVEQSRIPAGLSAPYRADFDVTVGDVAASAAQLQRADAAAPDDRRYIDVVVEDQDVKLENGRYVITAVLRNPGPESARAIRLVATVRDAGGQVIGYRVAALAGDLGSGETTPARVEIVPQVVEPEPKVTLYVEARRGDPSPDATATSEG